MRGPVSHQENAIKNYKEVTGAYSLERLASKGQVTNPAGMMEKLELSHTAGGNGKMVWLLWRTVWNGSSSED